MSLELEASRRFLGDNVQLVLEPDAIDRIDSIYLLAGDVADELASSAVLEVARAVPARLSVQAGRVRGDHGLSVVTNDATYLISGITFLLRPTGTSLGVRYRSWEQTFAIAPASRSIGTEGVDVDVAQDLPLRLFASFGPRWRALFSLEVGRRDDGNGEWRPNRRMAGGLALAF